MIPDLAYTSRNLYVSNQFRYKPTYLPSNWISISLYIKSFSYLRNALTNIKSIIGPMMLTKLTSVKEKSLNCI